MSAAQIFSILYRLKFLLSEGTLSPNIIHMKFAKFPYFPFAFFCVSAALAQYGEKQRKRSDAYDIAAGAECQRPYLLHSEYLGYVGRAPY